VSKHDVSITPSELKGKFIVPNMQSYKDSKSPFQYFSPLSASARIALEKECRDGISPIVFYELVSKLLHFPKSIVLLSTSKIDSAYTKRNCATNFLQVFAGGGSPSVDESYDKFDLPNSELMIFHKKIHTK